MTADLVIQNAKVFTANPRQPFVSGISVSGSTIRHVGNDIADHIGPNTEVIGADGGLVTPGFVDAHVHPATSGLDRLRCSFEEASNREDALRSVSEYARANPDEDWILGAGWASDWFDRGCPSAEDLDSVVSDRPVFLMNADGHDAWVNTAALARANIDGTTSDPSDGRIERLANGRPQGTLHEGAFILMERVTPEDTVEDFEAGLRRGQQELMGYGVTAWQDAAVTDEVHAAYLNLASRGGLVGRVVGAMWWDRHRGLDQIEELIARRERSAPGFRPTTVKLMLDGVAENYTASVLDPWLEADGTPTSNLGMDFIDPDELKMIVTALDSHGFQCHFHSLGDRAVRNALDAIQTSIATNGRNRNRHHLAHIQFVHPEDIPRFAALDAIANAQPLWACNDAAQLELTKPFITSERFSWQYPFRSLLDSGARVGMGSDWAVSTANVMAEVDVAINRTCPNGDPLDPQQRLTPTEALTAFTSGSAYINGAEASYGMLRPGMQADLVLFDRDPFVDGPFRDTEVAFTMIGGNIAYEA